MTRAEQSTDVNPLSDGALVADSRERAVGALLRIPALRRLWTAQFAGGVADRLALLVLIALGVQAAAAAEPFGGGYRGLAFAVAAVLGARILAVLVFGVLLLGPLCALTAPTGPLDRRWTMIGADGLRVALLIVAPLWIDWLPDTAVIWVVATAFAVGAAERVWTAARAAAAPTLLPEPSPLLAPAAGAAPPESGVSGAAAPGSTADPAAGASAGAPGATPQPDSTIKLGKLGAQGSPSAAQSQGGTPAAPGSGTPSGSSASGAGSAPVATVRPSADHLEALRRLDLRTAFGALPVAAAVLIAVTLAGNVIAVGVDWFGTHQVALASDMAAGLFAASIATLYLLELPRAGGPRPRSPLEGLLLSASRRSRGGAGAAGHSGDTPDTTAGGSGSSGTDGASRRGGASGTEAEGGAGDNNGGSGGNGKQGRGGRRRGRSDRLAKAELKGRTGAVPVLVFGAAATSAAVAAALAVAVLHAFDLGGGPIGFGLLALVLTGGPVIGARTATRVLPALSRRRLLPLAIAVTGLAMLLAGIVPDPTTVVLLCLLGGVSLGITANTAHTLLDHESGEARRTRTADHLHAVVNLLVALALIGGPLLAGAIGPRRLERGAFTFEHGGAAFTLMIFGAMLLPVAALVLLRIDDRRGVPLRKDLRDAVLGGPEPAQSPAETGFFIAVEGGDGAGKSTQVEMLAEWIRAKGHEVVVTREPGATAIGKRLRSILLDIASSGLSHRAEALLYAADRAEHVDSVIRPALARGAVVITDRYIDSSVAYQGAGRDLSSTEIARISRWATGALVPHLTVLLDISPEAARERFIEAPDRLESEPPEFHQRVRRGFLALAAADPSRYLVVDAAQDPDVVATAVRHRLDRELPLSEQEIRAREEAQRRAEEEARRRAEEEARRKAEEERRERERQEQLARLRAEEEARRKAEEEEARRREAERQAEEARRRAEEARRRAEEEARRRAEEEEARRREQERVRRLAEEQERLRREAEERRLEKQRRAEEALLRAEEERRRAEAAAAAAASAAPAPPDAPEAAPKPAAAPAEQQANEPGRPGHADERGPEQQTERNAGRNAGQESGHNTGQNAGEEAPAGPDDVTQTMETPRPRPGGDDLTVPLPQLSDPAPGQASPGRASGPASPDQDETRVLPQVPGQPDNPDEAPTTTIPQLPDAGRTAVLPRLPDAEDTAVLRQPGAPGLEGPKASGAAGPGRGQGDPADRVPQWLWRPEPEAPNERTRELPQAPHADAPADGGTGRAGNTRRRPRPEWAEETPLDDLPTLADELLGPRLEQPAGPEQPARSAPYGAPGVSGPHAASGSAQPGQPAHEGAPDDDAGESGQDGDRDDSGEGRGKGGRGFGGRRGRTDRS